MVISKNGLSDKRNSSASVVLKIVTKKRIFNKGILYKIIFSIFLSFFYVLTTELKVDITETFFVSSPSHGLFDNPIKGYLTNSYIFNLVQKYLTLLKLLFTIAPVHQLFVTQ